MRLVDTSAWIEWLIGSPLGAIVASTATALMAADHCVQHKLATADAIVYATARAHGAELLTCDRHFEGLSGVRFVPRARG